MTQELDAILQACEAHHAHAPKNLTVELHHIIPVAWQLHTPLPAGATPPSPGPDPDGRGQLWDDRGTWLCPTGHRNTHIWIVRLMRETAILNTDQPLDAYNAIRPKHPPAEYPIAALALQRLADYGSLLALTRISQWGQS